MLNVSFHFNNKYLTVSATGSNDDYGGLVDLTQQIYNKVVETKSRFLLLDLLDANLNLTWADAFNLVRLYETTMPAFDDVKAACLFNDTAIEVVTYWGEVARKRGYGVQLFLSRAEAERWLKEQIEADSST